MKKTSGSKTSARAPANASRWRGSIPLNRFLRPKIEEPEVEDRFAGMDRQNLSSFSDFYQMDRYPTESRARAELGTSAPDDKRELMAQ